MSNIVLIDGDICAVSSAAAAEERFWSVRGRRFKKKKDLKAALGDVPEEEIERIVEPAPFSHCRQNCRQMLQSIVDACAPVKDIRVFLSGPNNFRYKIATIKPYKGNRDRSEEPTWRQDIEEWMVTEWNAERTDGFEADDAISMAFVQDPKVNLMATLDKDMLTIEHARVWNWGRQEMIYVSPIEAKRNFYIQMLTGDACDNVPGVKGMGEAKSHKLLDPMNDPKAMEYAVYYAYKKAYGPKAWDAFVENGRLLHLWRKENDLWNPTITR